MGYYSNVALLLGQEADVELRTALVGAPEEVRQTFKICMTRSDIGTGLTLRHWEHVRWQDGVAEFVDTFLAVLDGDQYRFIRLGERFGDLDDYGGIYDSPFGLEVVTSIEFRRGGRQHAKNTSEGHDTQTPK